MREGWSYKKLGEVCSSIKDGSHNPPKGCSFSEYIMISSQNIFNEELRLEDVRYLGYDDFIIEDKRTNLRAGDVLLTIVGTIGRCYVFKGNEGNITLQRSVAVLSPKDFIDSRFLMYSLRGKNQVLVDEAHGIAQKGIYLKQLSSLEISYPNVSTQQQIVSELDLLSYILDQKRQQLKEYDALAESIFYDMFGDPKTSQWSKLPLKDLSISIGDGLHGTPIYDETGTYFFVNGNNLREGSIVIDKQTKRVNQSEFSKYKIEFTERTIFVSINGTIGNKAFYNNEDIILGKSACYIQLKEDINKQYVYFLLGTPYFFEYVGNELTGTTIKNVSLKSMRSLPIPLPPIELQNSFAAKIQSIEHQKQLLRTSIKETEMLFQSRMDYWFNG